MAIKIIDEVQYEKYSAELDKTAKELLDLRLRVNILDTELFALRQEQSKYYVEILGGEPTYSHSVELIDKFILDHNFNGTWPHRYRCERYFYYDEKSNTWDAYGSGLNVVYYREVDLRYNELKLEGKLCMY